jgi:hypothetical protein
MLFQGHICKISIFNGCKYHFYWLKVSFLMVIGLVLPGDMIPQLRYKKVIVLKL